jgi:hypothetical protein
VKYQSEWLYSLWGVGAGREKGKDKLAMSAGIGVRLPFEPLFCEVDTLYSNERFVNDDSSSLHVVRVRAALGVDLMKGLALFAGGGPLLDIDIDGNTGFEPHYFAGIQVF